MITILEKIRAPSRIVFCEGLGWIGWSWLVARDEAEKGAKLLFGFLGDNRVVSEVAMTTTPLSSIVGAKLFADLLI